MSQYRDAHRDPALEAEHQGHKPYDQRDAGHLVMPDGSLVSSGDVAFLTACRSLRLRRPRAGADRGGVMIVPGGERGWRSPAGGPALGASRDRLRCVLQRSGRRPAEFFHAVDWGFAGFMLAVSATVFVLVFVALERMA